MARLQDMIPPDEIVRWRSSKVIRPRRLLGWGAAYLVFTTVSLLLFAWVVDAERAVDAGIAFAALGLLWLAVDLVFSMASEMAVTEGHVVWAAAGLLFGGDGGIRRLCDIRAVDLEEGGGGVTLYCDDENHYLELTGDGDLEAMARAIGRPARIWRKSTSRMARRARRWQVYSVAIAATAAASFVGAIFGLIDSLLDVDAAGEATGWVAGLIAVVSVAVFVAWAAEWGKLSLPHFLVGRRLSGTDRRDFVGALTDLRWQGVKPDGSDDKRLPRSRLAGWAMRAAYGEIPDLSAYGSETVVSGSFPADV